MHFRTNNACKRTTKAISCIIQIYLKVNLHHIKDLTRNLNLIHRDGFRILNPDVSPLKSVSQIHRNGPETAKSDVSPQKQVF